MGWKHVIGEDSLVDFSKYAQDDKEHVNWYYEALEKEEAFWMEPTMEKMTGSFREYMTLSVFWAWILIWHC